jgi:hypothetical protein
MRTESIIVMLLATVSVHGAAIGNVELIKREQQPSPNPLPALPADPLQSTIDETSPLSTSIPLKTSGRRKLAGKLLGVTRKKEVIGENKDFDAWMSQNEAAAAEDAAILGEATV